MTLERITLPALQFGTWKPRIRRITADTLEIFDIVRKRWLILTPEEWVRQSLLYHLVQRLGYPLGLIFIEHLVNVEGQPQRADVVVFTRAGSAFLLIECKAPQVSLDKTVLLQALRYNATVGAPWLALTNGIKHYIYYRAPHKGASFQLQGHQFPPYPTE